jgi:hypothetical protein
MRWDGHDAMDQYPTYLDSGVLWFLMLCSVRTALHCTTAQRLAISIPDNSRMVFFSLQKARWECSWPRAQGPGPGLTERLAGMPSATRPDAYIANPSQASKKSKISMTHCLGCPSSSIRVSQKRGRVAVGIFGLHRLSIDRSIEGGSVLPNCCSPVLGWAVYKWAGKSQVWKEIHNPSETLRPFAVPPTRSATA